jgi:hypothetical protein
MAETPVPVWPTSATSPAGLGVVAPTVLGRIAEHPPGFVDGQQGLSLTDLFD